MKTEDDTGIFGTKIRGSEKKYTEEYLIFSVIKDSIEVFKFSNKYSLNYQLFFRENSKELLCDFNEEYEEYEDDEFNVRLYDDTFLNSLVIYSNYDENYNNLILSKVKELESNLIKIK